MEKKLLMPMFYLPSVSYFTYLKNSDDYEISIEKFENFPKQTFRNRACIYSPNGRLNLIIPVVKGSKNHTLYKDVKISYNDDWQRNQWLSLQTSYRRSAYFEYYEDQFAPFYEKKFDYLFDFNQSILNLILKILKIDIKYYYTESFIQNTDLNTEDLRSFFSSKKLSDTKNQSQYFQLFNDKYGFQEDLSIVDLLFNHGPQAKNYLL